MNKELPFVGNQDEMIVMNTIQDQNVLHLTFQFKYEHDKLIKQSLNHLTNLIGHEGPGSLF